MDHQGIALSEHRLWKKMAVMQLGLYTHLYISPEPSSITELIMAFVVTKENVGSVFVFDRMKCNYYMCHTDILKQKNMLSG